MVDDFGRVVMKSSKDVIEPANTARSDVAENA